MGDLFMVILKQPYPFWIRLFFYFSMRLAVRMVGVGIRIPTDEVIGSDFRGRLIVTIILCTF